MSKSDCERTSSQSQYPENTDKNAFYIINNRSVNSKLIYHHSTSISAIIFAISSRRTGSRTTICSISALSFTMSMFSCVSLLLFVTLTHSAEASMNSVLLSALPFFSTMMQVAIEVPKNRLLGNWACCCSHQNHRFRLPVRRN